MKTLKTTVKNFFKCGLTGWCMEIIFTSIGSFLKHDFRLKGVTSIWMFPIYGLAFIIAPISKLLKSFPTWFRGLTYMSMIFSTEYLSGRFLDKHHICPWDYSDSKWNIDHVIRLDYAPYWFGAGLLFEKLVKPVSKK